MRSRGRPDVRGRRRGARSRGAGGPGVDGHHQVPRVGTFMGQFQVPVGLIPELQHGTHGVQAGPAAGSLTYEGPGRLFLPETRGVPSEVRVGGATRQRPGEAFGQRERGAFLGPALGPGEPDLVPRHPGIDGWAQEECEAERMASRRLELVDDFQTTEPARPAGPSDGAEAAGRVRGSRRARLTTR